MADKNERAANFVEAIIDEDIKSQKYAPEAIRTRFPPEPNGYLHIGHAKSICLNFGLAQKFGGQCNLRFDDTNPVKEDVEYVDSIQEDVRWLGFTWDTRKFYASDYFERLYGYAVELIRRGKAFVCDLSADEIRAYRGTLTEPGKESPFRNRSAEENLALFERMRAGEFADGSHVLRAKIDMASPNITMRDPVLYRIAHAAHHRTGEAWCIYPMYDFAHPLSDAIEGITHSVCTLEFEDHRPLYDWLLEALGFDEKRPHQYEFARLNLTNTVMSKRKLRQLVEGGYVAGWDDPRMPTISGLRRRGYPAAAVRDFCERIGVAKSNSLVDVAMLEHCVREDLNANADRVMAVLEPLKVVITNYPAERTEYLLAENHPVRGGRRYVPFSREIFIEREDFMEEPPKKFFRLRPGGEVRLKHAYIIRCEEVVKDAAGRVAELRCVYDPDSKTGGATAGRKIKGTLHWVDAKASLPAEVRLYDYLLRTDEDGKTPDDFLAGLNPDSLRVRKDARIEPSVRFAAEGTRYQFLRKGYFCVDKDSSPGHLVFNETVGLKDTWAKVGKEQA